MSDLVHRGFVLASMSLPPSSRLQDCDYEDLLCQMTAPEHALGLQCMTDAGYRELLAADVEQDGGPLRRGYAEDLARAMDGRPPRRRGSYNRGSNMDVGGHLVAWFFLTSVNDVLQQADRDRDLDEDEDGDGHEVEENEEEDEEKNK